MPIRFLQKRKLVSLERQKERLENEIHLQRFIQELHKLDIQSKLMLQRNLENKISFIRKTDWDERIIQNQIERLEKEAKKLKASQKALKMQIVEVGKDLRPTLEKKAIVEEEIRKIKQDIQNSETPPKTTL